MQTRGAKIDLYAKRAICDKDRQNRQGFMYGPQTTMNSGNTVQHPGTTYVDEEEDDDVRCSNGKSIDNPPSQIRYEGPNSSHSPHALQTAGGGGVMDAVDTVALYEAGSTDMTSAVAPASVEGGPDQLTLSFQGEVYVFDSVSPEKVCFVLFNLKFWITFFL